MNTPQLIEREKQAQKLIVKEVEKALLLMQAHFKKYCEEVAPTYNDGKKATSVPMVYIERSTKIFLDNYKKAAEK